jgi:hypothetical protein
MSYTAFACIMVAYIVVFLEAKMILFLLLRLCRLHCFSTRPAGRMPLEVWCLGSSLACARRARSWIWFKYRLRRDAMPIETCLSTHSCVSGLYSSTTKCFAKKALIMVIPSKAVLPRDPLQC